MPLVKISILKGWSDNQKKELNNAIHKALVKTLNIPEWDFFHRINEYSKIDFIFPEVKSNKFIILEIHLYPGRKKETKKLMFKEICANLINIGIPKMDIFIQIIEQPLHNWGIKGGNPANETDINIKP